MITLKIGKPILAMIALGIPCELVGDDGQRVQVTMEETPGYEISIFCTAVDQEGEG